MLVLVVLVLVPFIVQLYTEHTTHKRRSLVPATREARGTPLLERTTRPKSALVAAAMRMGLAALACVLVVATVADARDSFHTRPCAKAGNTNMEASGNANVSANVPTALSSFYPLLATGRRSG